MENEIQRGLSRANHVIEFNGEHPSTDPDFNAVATELVTVTTRATALTVQQNAGLVDERASRSRRREIISTVLDAMRHLWHVGKLAAVDHPELGGKFVAPKRRPPHQAVIAAAKSMLAAAIAAKDTLAAYGLGQTFVDDLQASITQYDELTQEAAGGRASHVGASADLYTLVQQCGRLVNVLNGLNRSRFRDDAELLAAWQSARNVRGNRSHPAPKPIPAPAPAQSKEIH